MVHLMMRAMSSEEPIKINKHQNQIAWSQIAVTPQLKALERLDQILRGVACVRNSVNRMLKLGLPQSWAPEEFGTVQHQERAEYKRLRERQPLNELNVHPVDLDILRENETGSGSCDHAPMQEAMRTQNVVR